jgi:uncharacterized protein YutE (UPF0331/DUF86 family)
MVDEVRVSRLLRSVTDDLSALAREASASTTRRADPLWLSGVKYLFVTAIEACVDVAQHVCATQGWGPPKNNADAVALLGRHGVLEPDLATTMRAAVGFRNVLVHDYVDVDDAVVVARLADLSDLSGFVAAVAAWLERSGSSPSH